MTITVATKYQSYDSSHFSMLLRHYFILEYITSLVLSHFVQEPYVLPVGQKLCRIIINNKQIRVINAKLGTHFFLCPARCLRPNLIWYQITAFDIVWAFWILHLSYEPVIWVFQENWNKIKTTGTPCEWFHVSNIKTKGCSPIVKILW